MNTMCRWGGVGGGVRGGARRARGNVRCDDDVNDGDTCSVTLPLGRATKMSSQMSSHTPSDRMAVRRRISSRLNSGLSIIHRCRQLREWMSVGVGATWLPESVLCCPRSAHKRTETRGQLQSIWVFVCCLCHI